jgi:hypothetical protein
VRASSRATNENLPKAQLGLQFGDYMGVAAAGGAVHPVWTDTRDLKRRREEIYTATLRWPP